MLKNKPLTPLYDCKTPLAWGATIMKPMAEHMLKEDLFKEDPAKLFILRSFLSCTSSRKRMTPLELELVTDIIYSNATSTKPLSLDELILEGNAFPDDNAELYMTYMHEKFKGKYQIEMESVASYKP